VLNLLPLEGDVEDEDANDRLPPGVVVVPSCLLDIRKECPRRL
jgi:hypothetical protein